MHEQLDSRMLLAFRVFVRLGSVAAIAFSTLLLAAWFVDIQPPDTVKPLLPTMSPLSALGLGLAGASLRLRVAGKRNNGRDLPAIMLVCVSLLGLASFARVGHDTIWSWMSRFSASPHVHHTHAMPITTLCLLLLGLALLLSGERGARPSRTANGFTLLGLSISGLVILGYAYDVHGAWAILFYQSMALHSAIALFVLFLVCLASEPRRGLAALLTSAQLSARVSRVQLLLVILLPFAIGLMVLRAERGRRIDQSLAMAVVVIGLVVPLVTRILRDGRMLAAIEHDRQRAVDAQVRLNEELEQRVLDRTRSLEISEARLRAFFDNAPEGLILCRILADDRLAIESISPSMRSIYRLDERPIAQIDVEQLFDGASNLDIRRQLATCLDTGQPHRYTARRLIGGSVRLLDVILVPIIVAPAGGEQLIAGSVRDVTDAERAAEQLRQSQKMEAVGQLTGGLAHDFNNLLTGITGSLELMGMRIAQDRFDDLPRYIDTCMEAAGRAAALTHRLLAFSRRQTLDPRPTAVNEVVAGMAELIRRTAGPAIAVEVEEVADLWTALIDANQLENALLNLCLNARDAMPAGGLLTISTANVPASAADEDMPPGDQVCLAISDTGTGMTPEILARAFDPFFTTKPLGQGTGLGLSMIHGFVHQSGGFIRITSTPAEGTLVRLFLPRHLSTATVAPGIEPVTAGAAGRRRTRTILMVDDEAAIRGIVSEVLEERGYRILQAEDAAGGLAIVRSEQAIDMLVSDIGLPGGMNGRQFVDAARLIRPRLPVLFITGYAETAVLDGREPEDDTEVLTKPFKMDKLLQRVRRMMQEAAEPAA